MKARSILDMAEQTEYVPVGELQVEFDQLQKRNACILPANTTKRALLQAPFHCLASESRRGLTGSRLG